MNVFRTEYRYLFDANITKESYYEDFIRMLSFSSSFTLRMSSVEVSRTKQAPKKKTPFLCLSLGDYGSGAIQHIGIQICRDLFPPYAFYNHMPGALGIIALAVFFFIHSSQAGRIRHFIIKE
jgi:hypothetical protein